MKHKRSTPPCRGRVMTSLLASIGAAGIALGITSWIWSWPLPFSAGERGGVTVQFNDTPLVREPGISTSFAPVVERVASSVVYVYSTKMVRNPLGLELRPLFEDPLFRRFFGDRFHEEFPRRSPRLQKQQSLGSGVVVSRDGHILTNNHIVDGADEVRVALSNGKREFLAKVVGRDTKTDIAILKIDAGDLPPATFADSNKVAVGDVVLAIGNPFGIGQTVTMGIVSATQRGGMGIEEYEDFIQTDASINPGNSGGALVDTQGRLVGICTAILSRSGANQGVGFAVPVDLARSVMDQILMKGKVVRGYLGVSIQDLTPELLKDFAVPEGRGALIGGVVDGGSAAEAGLRSGDVIVEVDGRPVLDSRGLKLMVGQNAPGKKLEIKIWREGKFKSLSVTLKEMPDSEPVSDLNSAESEGAEATGLSGVELTDIDDEARRKFALPAALGGALVAAVDEDSVAFEAGLRDGDVIQEINHKSIATAKEAMAAAYEMKGKRLMLRVWSRGSSHFLVVDESPKR